MKELNFKHNLQVLRKECRLSQKELAKMVNVDQRTVSAWENGICEPSFTVLLQLCNIFKVDTEELLTK